MQHFIQSTQAVHRAGLLLLGVCGLILLPLVSNGQDGAEYVTVVSAKAPPKFASEIKGVVIDGATKKPLSGARVFYKNLTTSITGDDGQFTLAVPGNNVSVGVDIPGYQSREIPIDGRKKLNIALNEADRPSLFNPLILANHAMPANRLTNAATTADQADVWTRYNETPDSYMQGKLAGLNVIRSSGTGNARANLLLRGYSSLLATNQPLIIVDNLIYDNGTYGSSLANNYAENPLANIDVRDISNITVLKDAAVTAQYGTKAANGVIVITTSKAKDLGTRIDLSMNGGMNMAPTSLPVLNAGDYRTYLAGLLTSGGASTASLQALPYFNDAQNSGTYYQYHNNTDWQKKIFDNSLSNNVYLKVTGGDNIAKYALSMNYLTNNTALAQSNVSKYSTRFNADLNLSNRLKGVANMAFSYNEASIKDLGFAPKTNPIFLSLVKSPFLTDYEVSSTGVASPDFADEDIFKVGNPAVVSSLMQASNRAYRFVGGLGLQYNVLPGLELGANVSVIFDKIKENRFVPRRGIVSDTLSNAIAQNQLGSQTKRLFNFNTEAYAAYNKTIQYRHEFSARLGVRYLNSKTEQDRISGYNSATDELISAGNGIAILNNLSGGLGQYNWLNTYLNVNYAYADKYFVSFSGAMDGSSRFGTQVTTESVGIGGLRYALMPAVSAAWQISSEKFMGNTPFDLLKLRASYGRVGNDDIGNYGARQYYTGQNLLGIQGLIRNNIANPGLKWETVTKANLGLDMSFLNDRVSLSLDLFTNKTTDMLVVETTPTVVGISTMLRNGGAMTTSGLEASLNVKLLNTPALKWDINVNIGRAASVIDQLPDGNLINSFGNATYLSSVGQAPNAFYGYVAQGVYSTDAQATAAGLQTRLKDGSLRPFRGGDIRFADLDNNKIIDERDRQIIGNPTPNLFGGVNNHVSYGNFSFDALITFVSGNSLYNYTRNALEAMSSPYNQSQATLNRWRGDGQVTDVPRATLGDPLGNSRFSSRWIEDGSYIRLRNVSASYNFPINRALLKYLTLYASANNLLTFTNYLGYDPEFSATSNLFGQGVDNTLEPIQKSVQIGVKFGL